MCGKHFAANKPEEWLTPIGFLRRLNSWITLNNVSAKAGLSWLVAQCYLSTCVFTDMFGPSCVYVHKLLKTPSLFATSLARELTKDERALPSRNEHRIVIVCRQISDVCHRSSDGQSCRLYEHVSLVLDRSVVEVIPHPMLNSELLFSVIDVTKRTWRVLGA